MPSPKKSTPTPLVKKYTVNYEEMYMELNNRYISLVQEKELLQRSVRSLTNAVAPEPTVNMHFPHAMRKMIEGYKIRRHGWDGFVALDGTVAQRIVKTGGRNGYISSDPDYFPVYKISAEDLLATDWELF